MNLGINPTIDDISADHLNRIRKELAAIGEVLPERVMIRIADAMHDACTASYAAGEHGATDVVPAAEVCGFELPNGGTAYYSL